MSEGAGPHELRRTEPAMITAHPSLLRELVERCEAFRHPLAADNSAETARQLEDATYTLCGHRRPPAGHGTACRPPADGRGHETRTRAGRGLKMRGTVPDPHRGGVIRQLLQMASNWQGVSLWDLVRFSGEPTAFMRIGAGHPPMLLSGTSSTNTGCLLSFGLVDRRGFV
ncbi:DUF5133 domain-containing protein [Streptomyces sp. NPDC050416]|uniref:DUF5133 domain-containing protein n=1 Tax=Streptomyces sp. NPDC050416 TaxID=3365611 RepID=UPI00378A5F2C